MEDLLKAAFAPNQRLSNEKRDHLAKVYSKLFFGLFSVLLSHQLASFYLTMQTLATLASMVAVPLLMASTCYFVCASNRTSPQTKKRLHFAYYLIAICFGICISQMSAFVSALYPNLIQEALAITTMVFAGFTAASFFADKSTLLGVYGAIGALSIYLLFVSISSFFTHRFYMSPISMFATVLFESLYLYLNTMQIVLRPSQYDKDALDDAYVLLSNLVNIFITIVQQLLIKEGARRRRRDDDRDNDDN